MGKIRRNDPCPCGSGKKYKKCCEGRVSEPVPLPAAGQLPRDVPPQKLEPAQAEAEPEEEFHPYVEAKNLGVDENHTLCKRILENSLQNREDV